MPGLDVRSPFFTGALRWLYEGRAPAACPTCRFDWMVEPSEATALIAAAPAALSGLLEGRDGMAAVDGGWNATAYLCHLTDLARGWSERWAQLASTPGSTLVPWDLDGLAAARNYCQLPTAAALWALPGATAMLLDITAALAPDTEFMHAEWGIGTVGDTMCWLAHEFVHHQLDVDQRAAPQRLT